MTSKTAPDLATPADNALIAQALTLETAMPTIEPLPLDEVTLAAGLLRADGSVAVNATVRELTGAHEELIVRARNSSNPLRILASLVECGTATIGGQPVTRDQLGSLLSGDWMTLLIGIRCVTYGPGFDVENVTCPNCGEVFDLEIDLSRLELTKLAKPTDRQFWVDLRKGRAARVKLPTGHDQELIYDKPNLSFAERNSLILSHLVLEITEDFQPIVDVTRNPTWVRDEMSIPDRHTVLEAIAKAEPGPRLNELSFTHETCGQEVPFPVEIGDLFRGL